MTPDAMRATLADWALWQHTDGVREDGNTNAGEPVRRYALPQEPPASWCARMVRAGLLHVGALAVASRADLYEMGSARYLYAWLVKHGAVVVPFVDVQPGDLRFLLGRGRSDPLKASGADGGIHHVGIVASLVLETRTVKIVDGNWADRVSLNVETIVDARSLWLRWPVDT